MQRKTIGQLQQDMVRDLEAITRRGGDPIDRMEEAVEVMEEFRRKIAEGEFLET